MTSDRAITKGFNLSSFEKKRPGQEHQYWYLVVLAVICLCYQFYLLDLWSSREIGIEYIAVASSTMAFLNCLFAVVIHGYFISFLSAYIAYSYVSLFSMTLLFLWQGESVFHYWFHIEFHFNTEDLHYAGNFMIINSMAMSCLALGVCIPLTTSVKRKIISFCTSRLVPHWYRRTSQVLSVLCFISSVFLILCASYYNAGIELFLLKGYSFGYHHQHVVLGYAFSYLFFWSILYALASAPSRKQLTKISPVLVILGLLPLVIGDRGGAGKSLLCILFAYTSLSSHRMGLKTRTLAVIFVLAVFLIPFIEQARQDTREYLRLFRVGGATQSTERIVSDHASSQGLLQRPFNDYSAPVRKLLRSFCYASIVGPVVLANVPRYFDYQYGRGYLSTLKRAVPFTSGYFARAFPEISRADPFDWIRPFNKSNAGTGFLQVYEAYLEFGLIGVLVSNILIGLILSQMWNIYRAARSNPAIAFYLPLIFTGFFDCVRGTSSNLMLCIVWGFFLTYTIPFFFSLLFPMGRYKVVNVNQMRE